MPLSRTRQRPRIPLLRSFSANAAASDSDNSAASIGTQDDQQGKAVVAGNLHGRSSGGWSLPLPTLSTLANFNFHRRARAKSEAKRKSIGSKAGSRERDQERVRKSSPSAPRLVKLSPRQQSPNGAGRPEAPATSAEPTSTQACRATSPTAAAASPSFDQPASSTQPDIPSSLAVANAHSLSHSNSHISLSETAPTSNTATIPPPSTPPRPNPDCPRIQVQRPSTPTIPTADPETCARHDSSSMVQRKIWVKRAGASATRVEVADDDLVDNVRDVILQKYAKSLGRNIDSPDMILKIVSREQSNKNVSVERVLGPEESIGLTLNAYFPGGQTVDEALIIDVPALRTTPRISPRPGNHHIYYYPEQYRPDEAAREYFPPMQVHSPHLGHVPHAGPGSHSMAVLTTGQLPPLPSPGSHGPRRHTRPKYGRQHTSSPTILHTVQSNGSAMGTFAPLNRDFDTDGCQNPKHK